MILNLFDKAYEVAENTSVGDLLKAQMPDDWKKYLVVRLEDGTLCDLFSPIAHSQTVTPLTFDDPDGRKVFFHSASHLMAMAVKHLFPEAKLAIGPAIADGFYYDFDTEVPFTMEDLAKIEKEMQRCAKKSIRPRRYTLPRAEAIAYMQGRQEPYKVELIEDLPEDEVLSFYEMGDFTDLCVGPHLPNLSYIKAFKLTHVAGAYWRGDEHNKMLCRIYATAFPTKEQLQEHLDRIEEAKKRDHRKLGRELDLFDIRDEGPGFPFFYPKGMILRNILEDYWREIHRKAGYEEIKTPIMLNRGLWERSGHWDHYKENMYTTKIDDTDFAIKPMNCPGGILVYQRRLWSYRDLPIRSGELGLVHRHEKSGALHGLMRVRCFTQDDAHIFMTPEQIKDEIKGVYNLINEVYTRFGFPYHVELSTRPENSIGTDEMWEQATNGLQGALDELGVKYVINEGRRVLRPQDRLPSHRLPGTHLAVRHHPAGYEPARALRPDLYRPGRREAPSRDDSPRGVRLHRAVHRHSGGAFRRRVPHMAGACAGEGDDHHQPQRRGRARGGRPADLCGPASGAGPAQ